MVWQGFGLVRTGKQRHVHHLLLRLLYCDLGREICLSGYSCTTHAIWHHVCSLLLPVLLMGSATSLRIFSFLVACGRILTRTYKDRPQLSAFTSDLKLYFDPRSVASDLTWHWQLAIRSSSSPAWQSPPSKLYFCQRNSCNSPPCPGLPIFNSHHC